MNLNKISKFIVNGDASKLKPISPPPAPPTISSHPKTEHHHSNPHEANSTLAANSNGHQNHLHSNDHPTHSNANQDVANNSLADDRKLEAISDSDEGPPSKKVKGDDPLGNVEMISEDSLSASKETADERENYLLMADDDVERYISDVFLLRARIPELEQIEAESRKHGAKQREVEKEFVEIVKDQISVRQLVESSLLMQTIVNVRAEFAKNQSESHGFDTH